MLPLGLEAGGGWAPKAQASLVEKIRGQTNPLLGEPA